MSGVADARARKAAKYHDLVEAGSAAGEAFESGGRMTRDAGR